MVMSTAIFRDILAAAAELGLTQKQLAAAAGVRAETLSRAKKRGSLQLPLAEALARAVGAELVLRRPAGRHAVATVAAPPAPPPGFRERYRALLWSNPDAPDEVLLRRALVRPGFRMLLDAAVEFGLPRLQREWDELLAADDPEALRARAVTEQLLRNIQDGFALASA